MTCCSDCSFSTTGGHFPFLRVKITKFDFPTLVAIRRATPLVLVNWLVGRLKRCALLIAKRGEDGDCSSFLSACKHVNSSVPRRCPRKSVRMGRMLHEWGKRFLILQSSPYSGKFLGHIDMLNSIPFLKRKIISRGLGVGLYCRVVLAIYKLMARYFNMLDVFYNDDLPRSMNVTLLAGGSCSVLQ